jgi:hypothetical protein
MSAAGFVPDWPAPANVRAVQSLRGGGVSRDAYSSLNMGLHVGDAAAQVSENRRLFAADWALPAEPAWLEQVHGTRIVDLDRPWSGAADGAVTGVPGRVCAVMTADCLPVLLCDGDGRRVGAVHAGWRGLAAGVLPAAIAALDVAPARILAWLGPAIGQSAYEVGAEVRDVFVALDPDHARAFRPNARGRWQADLYLLARNMLAGCGITTIHGGGACTHSEASRYFSHRREAPCGRMVSAVWIDELP